RINCLMELRDLGYQIGAGFMVGAPYQTDADVAADLKFIENIKPDMCGIGPFVPHHATPFSGYEGGTVEETCYLISIMRLIYPRMLIPATTALGTIDRKGREKGMLSGANVVMPNLSPAEVRGKYEIYDNKLSSGEEASENLDKLDRSLRRIGFQIVVDRGDIKLDPGGSGETRDLAMAGP
ncbi:MAG: [FeFe] hydrogenase H-cluster radical SAM maturase HydE, partial [Coriobacteriales bacterium]